MVLLMLALGTLIVKKFSKKTLFRAKSKLFLQRKLGDLLECAFCKTAIAPTKKRAKLPFRIFLKGNKKGEVCKNNEAYEPYPSDFQCMPFSYLKMFSGKIILIFTILHLFAISKMKLFIKPT